MILSKTKPRLYLPAIMVSDQLSTLGISTDDQFVWGCLVIAYVGVNSKQSLIGLRFVLGIVEAGFFVSYNYENSRLIFSRVSSST